MCNDHNFKWTLHGLFTSEPAFTLAQSLNTILVGWGGG